MQVFLNYIESLSACATKLVGTNLHSLGFRQALELRGRMFILDPAGSRDCISTWLAVAAPKSADAQVTNPDMCQGPTRP